MEVKKTYFNDDGEQAERSLFAMNTKWKYKKLVKLFLSAVETLLFSSLESVELKFMTALSESLRVAAILLTLGTSYSIKVSEEKCLTNFQRFFFAPQLQFLKASTSDRMQI